MHPASLLFESAVAARRAGDVEAFRRAMAELVRTFPQSPWIPEAYVAFGDLYFEQGQPELAVQFYERVVAGFADAPVAAYAAYRLAWCDLAVDDATRALERFVRAIDHALAHGGADAGRILDAARRDVPLAYARVGRPEKAWNFFERVGRGPGEQRHADEMARRLVDEYRALGEVDAAAVVCRDLARHVGATPECSGH